MSGPRPLLLLAFLCALAPRAAAQIDDDGGRALSRKTDAMRAMAGAPRLTIIGDSHTVGPFGHELDAKLRAAYPGWKIETYASCGSSPNWFLPKNSVSGHTSACGTWFHRYAAKSPFKLEDLTAAAPTPLIGSLLDARPDTVIVALGANMADWEKGGIFGMDTATALAKNILDSGSRCLWIGPPDEAGHMDPAKAKAQVKDLNAKLKAALGESCHFIESHTTYTGSDPMRLHYPPGPAKAWADQAAADVQAVLGGGAAAAPTAPPVPVDSVPAVPADSIPAVAP